jgi:hypothetical protein
VIAVALLVVLGPSLLLALLLAAERFEAPLLTSDRS